MSGFWNGAGGGVIGATGGIISGGLSMIGQRKRNRRAFNQQKKLMNLQFQNQKELNQQSADLALQQWKDTNFPAQMTMIKEAGLSPALFYGMSGGGGTTAQTGSGGSASGGQAPSQPPMDIGAMLSGVTTAAQVQLMKAQADKAEAEASSIRGEKGTVGEALINVNLAEALNKRSLAKLNNLAYEIGDASKEDQIEMYTEKVEQLIVENELTRKQTQKAIAETSAIAMREKLDKANIKVSEETARKIANDIILGWKDMDVKYGQLQIANKANLLRGLEGKTKLQEVENAFILGTIDQEIDIMRITLEEKRQLISIFNNLITAGGLIGGGKAIGNSPLSGKARRGLREKVKSDN